MGDGERTWTRRGLLAGAVGGAAVLAATAIEPAATLAGVDGDVILGASNAATAPTTIDNSTADIDAFGATAAGDGVAVRAQTANGTGVHATVTAATGLSGNPIGVVGEVNGVDTGFGVVGTADIGVSGSGNIGVIGDSATLGGAGVFGYGEAAGCGVYGAVGGAPPAPALAVGVYAVATEPTGTALRVNGKAQFSRSGRIAVAAGRTAVVKLVPGVTASSIVIATLQRAATGTWIRAAVPSTGRFVVYFNRALPATTVVGWFVIN